MSHPDRQYVPPAQAEADKARLREARLTLQKTEIKVRLQQAESALNALREGLVPEAKQCAANELEKALIQLRKAMDELGSPPPRRP